MSVVAARIRRPRRPAVAMSLFPFLAVLICTMGALILLLVLIARMARFQAAEAVEAEQSRRQEEVENDLEMVAWRIEQLKLAREKTEEQLAQDRLVLGHLEDHSRRLRDEIAELEGALAELGQSGSQGDREQARLEAELARARADLETARQDLERKRQAIAERKPSYAVVPYRGPHGTFRRPIHIECRDDAVVLHPEGIVFSARDFLEPLGPGNPLASAVRAAREYLLMNGGVDVERDGEPYPLLLVRPDGVSAYYAARAALRSWGSDFGYELIEADWELAYPPPDPALAATVKEAVAVARVRQERIAAAAPRQYAARARPEYRVSHGPGGVVLDGHVPAPGGDGGYRPGGTTGRFAGGHGGSSGDGRLTGASGGSAGGPGGSTGTMAVPGGGGGTGLGSGGDGHGAPGDGGTLLLQPITPNRYAPDGRPLDSTTRGQSGRPSAGAEGGFAGQPGGADGGTPDGVADGASDGAAGTGTSGTSGGTSGGTTGGTAGGTAGSPAGTSGSPAGGPSGSDAGGATGGGSVLQFGEWRPSGPAAGGPPNDLNSAQSPSPSSPPSASRGENWGLPEAGRGAVPITRPIVIECHPDRLVILPEQGTVAGQVIPLGERLDGSLDSFVSAVWARMQSWGMAGAGMYWRPILRVRVAPGAEPRLAELKRLLDGSGLVVE